MYIYLDAPLLNTQLFFIHPFFDLPFIHFLKQIVSLYCSFLFIHIFIDFLLYFFLYLLPSSSLSLSLYLPNKQPYYNNTALDAVSIFSSDPLILESTSLHINHNNSSSLLTKKPTKKNKCGSSSSNSSKPASPRPKSTAPPKSNNSSSSKTIPTPPRLTSTLPPKPAPQNQRPKCSPSTQTQPATRPNPSSTPPSVSSSSSSDWLLSGCMGSISPSPRIKLQQSMDINHWTRAGSTP